MRYFSANDFERFRHARFTSGSQPIGVRAADQDGFGPCGQCHQDIQTRPNAAVHQDLDVRTLEGGRDCVQHFERRAHLVELPSAVIRDHQRFGAAR